MSAPMKNKKSHYLLRDIPPALKRRAKIYAARNETSLRAVILEALEDYLKNKKEAK